MCMYIYIYINTLLLQNDEQATKQQKFLFEEIQNTQLIVRLGPAADTAASRKDPPW
jgi:hypothetical protein